jgi:hypothetical protein
VRFLEQGADIPDDLIREVTSGAATFLCGAGVSLRVNLPSFKQLTERVYARINDTPDNEPAERLALQNKEYDRALRSLEKRTQRPGTISRVRIAVEEELVAPAVELPDHFALLQLSRDIEGRARLLTTNFDTLFERAARKHGIDVPSHSGRSIPRPGGVDDHGILHLHGRIADPDLDLTRTDYVLTSADFGDAYLRDGWASREIADRMRQTTLVLVGYAAEDVAMRLLLETLDTDRRRFRDLKKIYAFDRRKEGSAFLWHAKGIEAIEFEDYDAVYLTLREWARYTVRPAEYARRRVREILGSATGHS